MSRIAFMRERMRRSIFLVNWLSESISPSNGLRGSRPISVAYTWSSSFSSTIRDLVSELAASCWT
jgi:hypothetical protein